MNNIYVLVFSYDNKSIADNVFFSSPQEAISWKKEQIAKGECLNSIESYGVMALVSQKLFDNISSYFD